MGWGSGEPGGRLLGGGVTGGRRQGMLCVVFRERVIYNGCIMSSCVGIFEGGWLGWVYVKDVDWIVDVG
jgi:hypothetical protein